MNNLNRVRSKLDLDGDRVVVSVDHARSVLSEIFSNIGCAAPEAHQIADHLVDASLCGVESHGLMRTLQYSEQFESGYMTAGVTPRVRVNEQGGFLVDGGGGHGIPAMHLAVSESLKLTTDNAMSVLGIVNVGHTGRLGAFTEQLAEHGLLSIIVGGGGHETWRQVAPYGGRKALLPTNPYSIAIPGGECGPVVLDFATSKIAGGWIYAARSGGALLPDNVLINAEGEISRHPEDYFAGGAILPAGGPKGYGLAVAAELIAEAVLGPTSTEGNWLMINIDTRRFNGPGKLRDAAESILSELRACPPVSGFDRVEIPGERERDYRKTLMKTGIPVPERTWQQIIQLAERLSRRASS